MKLINRTSAPIGLAPIGLKVGCDRRVQSVYFETQTDSGWASGPIEEVACGRPPIVVQPGDTWSDSIGFGGCYRRPNCFTDWVADSTSAQMRVFLSVYRVERNSRLSNVPVHDVVHNPFVVNLALPPQASGSRSIRVPPKE